MNSESSSAAAEVTKIYPKLLRRLFYVWIVIAPMVIYELHYGQKVYRRKALSRLHDGFCQQIPAHLLRFRESLPGFFGTRLNLLRYTI